MTFVIIAKFVITSIWSRQKSVDCVYFHRQSHVILQENICFGYLLESPHRGDSNKYTKRMVYKKKYLKYRLLYALDGSISKFFLTANLILQQNRW